MAKRQRKASDYIDPPTLHSLVIALPPGKQADKAYAEYATIGRLYERLATTLQLLDIDESRIPALLEADDRAFCQAVAVAYRHSIDAQGFIWVAEVAQARKEAAS